jgi:3-isopropylmalate/(R)-2-methylmalate dehydratase small subunit
MGAPTVPTAAKTVRFDDRTIAVTVNGGQRKAVVDGILDTTALMKSNQATADPLPYTGAGH